MAPLLELGGGFRTELTGRENIYFNGAIMGLKRHEITSRVEYCHFAELGDFIDSPYRPILPACGRLGFAVATIRTLTFFSSTKSSRLAMNGFVAKLRAVESFFKADKAIVIVSYSMDLSSAIVRGLFEAKGQIVEDGAPKKSSRITFKRRLNSWSDG